MTVLSVLLLALVAAASLALLALGLPGTWLLLAGVLAAVGVSPQAAVTLGMAGLLLGLCLLAELLEFGCSYFGAKRYGVSTPGVWGGILGGIAGALALGTLLPIVGAVPGAFLGTFLGAFGVELARGSSREQAARQGFGAFLARIVALVAKLGVALAMAGLGLAWIV